MANTKQAKPAAEKKVKIKLLKDMQHIHNERVYVNGKGYSIPRGVEVEVPESVADVIANSELQKQQELAYISKTSE